MNQEPTPPEQVAESTPVQLGSSVKAPGCPTNAYKALLSGADLSSRKHLLSGPQDMRSQVQALQRAIALFRLKP
jgi:hypothetical protein